MPTYSREFLEKCRPLTDQLGGDRIAALVARGIVRQMDMNDLSQLQEYYKKKGSEALFREITDLRCVGSKTAEVIMQRIVSARGET